MKTKLALVVLTLLISFLSNKLYTQDFNLFNPSNELYLFSAHDEGANAFRYNPAVLGLGHRLNVTLNLFLHNFRKTVYLDEIDLLANAGSFGISFRTFVPSIPNRDFEVTQFSLGFGAGNKTLSAGLIMEAMFMTKEGPPEYFEHQRSNKYKAGFGLLFRPSSFISTAFTFKSGESFASDVVTANKYTLGVAVRPLNKNLLTIMADYSFLPYYKSGLFKYFYFKAGIEAQPFRGLFLNTSYSILKFPTEQNSINIGIRFDFPNTSIRYVNQFNRISNGNYSENNPYRSGGNILSLSYNMEKRKSIVPERKKIIEVTLSGSLQDYNTEDVFFGLLGKGKRSIHEVIADIDYAAADPSVKGMLLKIYPISAGRFEITAGIEELTNSLERFKSKGKTVTAYFPQDAGPGEYYISTFANDIIMPPEAFFFYGLSIDVMNYHQFLQKYGIDLQVLHAGKYKLTFQGLLDSTSEEGKEVINRMLDIIYEKDACKNCKGEKPNA